MLFSPTLIIALVVLVAVFAGLIVLQTVLSKSNTRVPGVILPVIAFAAAIAFSIPNFIASFHLLFSPGAFFASLLMFALYNVPTVVFVLIYAWQRRKLESARQLTKTNVQDL